jgi:hypothetical protein
VVPELQSRRPGSGLPEAVRDAAARAGGRCQSVDPVLLRRVREALARVPDHALLRHYLGDPRRLPGLSVRAPGGTISDSEQTVLFNVPPPRPNVPALEAP